MIKYEIFFSFYQAQILTKSVCVSFILYLCKEQFFLFTIMSFVLISVFYISQELAKYQKDATYDHGFLHSRSVIG